jgi:uncharacterized membrane protein
MNTSTTSQSNIDPKAYGIFVGLFNKENNTEISVKAALQMPEMIELFKAIGQACQGVKSQLTSSIEKVQSKTTRRRSLNETDLSKVDLQVLQLIRQNSGKSRAEIAGSLKRRISTICASASRLNKAGLIYASGEILDLETNRTVEVLSATPQKG